METPLLGKWLIGAGLSLAAVGVVVTLGSKIPGLGWLPGDIYIKRENFSFYFPLATCLVVSLAANVLFRLFKK